MNDCIWICLVSLLAIGCTRNDPQFCANTPDRTCPMDMSTGPGGGDIAMAQGCMKPEECPVSAPVCRNMKCVGCDTTADGGTSSECAMLHTATPYCGAGGACVECNGRDDCAAAGRTCNAMHACVPCARHGDCTSGVCLAGGMCAPRDQVFFVDNRGMDPAVCKTNAKNADGKSRSSAFCDVVDAITVNPTRPYVVVAGSTTVYGPLSITATTNTTVTIVGPGKSATLRAAIAGPMSKPAVSILPPTAMLDIAFDGMEFIGSNINMTDGIDCSGANMVRLAIRNSFIHSSSGSGLGSTKCNVTLDGNLITRNMEGAIALASTTYLITNNFIYDNSATMASAVSIDALSTGQFAFNTVVFNGPMGGLYGGITCLGQGKTIEASIVWSNTQLNGTQIFGTCQLNHVVTGMDSYMGATKLVPAFVNSTDRMKPIDLHLVKDNNDNIGCCVDVVKPFDGGPARLPDHDYDGTMRPIGNGWDVGAHEVQ